MQIAQVRAVLTIALLTIALLGCADASNPTALAYFEFLDADRNDQLSVEEYVQGLWFNRKVPLGAFNRADANNDGFLSDTELLESESAGMTFKVFAESQHVLSQGQLSIDQYTKAATNVWKLNMRQLFTKSDQDKDGTLTITEFRGLYGKILSQTKNEYFDVANANGDEVVSLAEWEDMIWTHRFASMFDSAIDFFEEADRNHDRVLELKELVAYDSVHHKDATASSVAEHFNAMVPEGNDDRTKLTQEEFMQFLNREYQHTAHKTFESTDTNKDGKVTKEEWNKAEDHGIRFVEL